ncbi:MAG: MFS transporter [Burkholderiaceae bacterium]|nr:MFS transporter [Burkholderiaceae bacterium]
MARNRLVPVIVASPLFLQNIDSTVMATVLPSIAETLRVPPLHLNLAITSYLLSLAVFLPISGWLAERFGAKRVFCLAIAFFSLGSALCGIANSLPELVVFRVLQGMGGAMMVPVGRLIMLRSVPASQMVSAMVWFTVPPVIGRLLGPLLGGAIVTVTSWRWIFLINIPFGILAIALAMAFVSETPEQEQPVPFDGKGFALLALSLTLLLGALETVGKALLPIWASVLLAGLGAWSFWRYCLHGRSLEHPMIDLAILRFRTFRTVVIGGVPLRLAIGASPFLLPLMLQLGFGMSPLMAGLFTMATAIGAFGTRFVMKRVILKMGFRHLLMGSAMLTSFFYMSYSLFSPTTPHPLMFATMLLGGLVNSLGMVAMATLGYADIPQHRMSHATSLSTVIQQLSLSFGVVLGASLVTAAAWWYGDDPAHLMARDFSPAFVVVGLLTMLSLIAFMRLSPRDGAEMQ